MAPMAVPARFAGAAHGMPFAESINVGRMYSLFAEAIRGGESRQPTFETAVGLHRLLDALEHSSATGREATFP